MEIKHFLYRHSNSSSNSERRLIYFAGGFDKRADRLDKVRDQIAEERERRLKATGNLSDRLNPNRVSAADVDEGRSGALRDAERQALLMGDTPESRRYSGALKKTQKLEQIYATQGKLEGMQYGFDGGDFTIVAADEKFVEWAMKYIVAQQKELQSPADDPAVEHAFNPSRETKEAYNQRMEALRKDNKQYEGNLRQRNNADVDEWKMVLSALEKYQSTFAAAQRFTKEVAANPRQILSASPSFKRDNPKQYKQLLRNSAAADPSVLRNVDIDGMNPADMTTAEFAQLIKDANLGDSKTGRKGNPLVLQYFPEMEKEKDGGKKYRDAMVAGAKVNGLVLRIASKEYDQHWKNKPEYTELSNNGVNQLPELFFRHAEWLQPKRAQALRDVEANLSAETKVAIVGLMTVQNLSIFDNLEGGWAGFIERLLDSSGSLTGVPPPPPEEESSAKRSKTSEKPNDAVLGTIRAISKNSALFEYVKKNDNPLYMKIFGELAKVDDPDMRETRTKFEGVIDDEDLVKAVLVKLQEFLKDGNVNAIRESKLDLSKIPEYVWKTGSNKELFIKIFSAQGELFELAPLWMRSKKEYALPIIINNASAYAHASENVRADPEILYAALLAEKGEKGNIHWKHVPQALRDRLANAGFEGMVNKDDAADTDKMLRVLILGLKEKEAVLTADKVHSFMDSWTDDMRNDKELVTAYLERSLSAHPEFYLDASEALRKDFSFVRKMVGINPKVFSFITNEQHLSFEEENQKGYRAMVASIVRFDPELFEKVPPDLRKEAEFITDIFTRTGRPELLKIAPKEMLKDVDFLVSVLQTMEQKGYVFKTVSEFLKMLPEDTSVAILLRNDGALLLKLLRTFKDEHAENLVPSSFISGDLLNRIFLQFKDEGNRTRMSDVLQRATPTARLAYLTEHPEHVLYLFEKSPVGIATVLHESLITVDLLTTLVEMYSDDLIPLLFSEILYKNKPQVLLGLLRRKQELWDLIGTRLQEKMLPSLDRDTLKMLRSGKEQREKEGKDSEMSRALDDLRTYRQEAIYLTGLAPKMAEVSIRWGDGKIYEIGKIQAWLERDRVPDLMKKVGEGTAKSEDVSKETDLYRTLVQAMRGAVDPVTTDTKGLTQSFDIAVNSAGIRMGEQTQEGVARVGALRYFIDAQNNRPLPNNLSPADSKKAKEFRTSAQEQYAIVLEEEIEKLSQATLRGMDAQDLRAFVRNAEKLLPTVRDHAAGLKDPLKKEEWNRMVQSTVKLKEEAKLKLSKVSEPAGVRQSEILYNLDAAALKFVEAAAKELGVDRVKFAMALEMQGSRNARVLTQEYLPMLKTPDQWKKVLAVAEAAEEPREALVGRIEAGNLNVFANYLLLSQEKHAAAIISAIKKDPEFPTGMKGEKGTFDAQVDRSMVMMASRAMGSAFDSAKLKSIWIGLRARQMEAFKSSPDIIDGPDKSAKKIDVFVIGEDDGPDGGARQAINRSRGFAAALNRQHPTERALLVSRIVGNKQQFSKALEEFKTLADDAKYGKDGDRHLVLRLVTHGNKSSGNALGIDPGAIASELNPASTTLLYTSCDGGTHLKEMFGTSLRGSKVNVLSEVSGTVAPVHTNDMIEGKISGAYEKDKDGKYVGDFNGDGVVSLPEAFHWLDRNSSFQDPQGFGPGGKQFTDNNAGKKERGIA